MATTKLLEVQVRYRAHGVNGQVKSGTHQTTGNLGMAWYPVKYTTEDFYSEDRREGPYSEDRTASIPRQFSQLNFNRDRDRKMTANAIPYKYSMLLECQMARLNSPSQPPTTALPG